MYFYLAAVTLYLLVAVVMWGGAGLLALFAPMRPLAKRQAAGCRHGRFVPGRVALATALRAFRRDLVGAGGHSPGRVGPAARLDGRWTGLCQCRRARLGRALGLCRRVAGRLGVGRGPCVAAGAGKQLGARPHAPALRAAQVEPWNERRWRPNPRNRAKAR